MTTIPVEFFSNSDGPSYVYCPGGFSYNQVWAIGPGSNAIPAWEATDTYAYATSPGVISLGVGQATITQSTILNFSGYYYPLPTGGLTGTAQACLDYANAKTTYQNALAAIAQTDDNADYTAALAAWNAALTAYGPESYLGVAASLTLLDTVSAIALANDPTDFNAAYAVFAAAYETFLTAYANTYQAYIAFNNTLADAIAYNAANPTSPNPYSSINVV
jgi:hypothetical protein